MNEPLLYFREYDVDWITAATWQFSKRRIVSQGWDSTVFSIPGQRVAGYEGGSAGGSARGSAGGSIGLRVKRFGGQGCSLSKEAEAAFQEHARALSRLSHPSLLPLVGYSPSPMPSLLFQSAPGSAHPHLPHSTAPTPPSPASAVVSHAVPAASAAATDPVSAASAAGTAGFSTSESSTGQEATSARSGRDAAASGSSGRDNVASGRTEAALGGDESAFPVPPRPIGRVSADLLAAAAVLAATTTQESNDEERNDGKDGEKDGGNSGASDDGDGDNDDAGSSSSGDDGGEGGGGAAAADSHCLSPSRCWPHLPTPSLSLSLTRSFTRSSRSTRASEQAAASSPSLPDPTTTSPTTLAEAGPSGSDRTSVPGSAGVEEAWKGVKKRMEGWEARLDVLVQVAGGLAYLHRQGMVHGSLGPANVLLWEKREGLRDEWVERDADPVTLFTAATGIPTDRPCMLPLNTSPFRVASGLQAVIADYGLPTDLRLRALFPARNARAYASGVGSMYLDPSLSRQGPFHPSNDIFPLGKLIQHLLLPLTQPSSSHSPHASAAPPASFPSGSSFARSGPSTSRLLPSISISYHGIPRLVEQALRSIAATRSVEEIGHRQVLLARLSNLTPLVHVGASEMSKGSQQHMEWLLSG
ncbi:unnamed protein product [Closterium sp. Naga37s-1]|nr:unnamed protein product [Closterium sp. Naga37s-1]